MQGMSPHKSAPSSKEEFEKGCNGEPCSFAVLSTRILRRSGCWVTLPAAPAASSACAVLSAAAAATAAALGAPGEQHGLHPFFPTPHLPGSSAAETSGGAAALTWGSPGAPPVPWPGERRPTGPAFMDPAHSLLPPHSLFSWAVEPPTSWAHRRLFPRFC